MTSVIVTSCSAPVVLMYLILYVSSCPATTALPSILVVSVPVNTSFFGWVGVGLVVVLVSTSLTPSFVRPTFLMTSPFTSSFTFTLNVTDTVVPVGTAIRFHVNTSPVNVPPLSAEPSTYVVYAGSLSVTTTS